MKAVIKTSNGLIKTWVSDLEDGAFNQANSVSNLPFVHKWIALMPDAHQGYGMPIGGVLPAKGVIIPNAVGVDIGCSVSSLKSKFPVELNKETLVLIRESILTGVPVGFNMHDSPQTDMNVNISYDTSTEEIDKYKNQLGTLGGGNHFIELQKDDDGFLYIMIHSGSRRFGYDIANHHHLIAANLCDIYHSNVPLDLAFLPHGTKEFENYVADMHQAMKYAMESHKFMMSTVSNILAQFGANMDDNTHLHVYHNYARLENHYGKNVFVHRKGATSAKKGEFGLIPGSMGTSSFIVRGLGNPESFTSCSHGAGRKMGRNEAKRTLNEDKEMKKMNGIVHGMNKLDEAPGAYKDINAVMESQSDLVEIITKLTPILNIKG